MKYLAFFPPAVTLFLILRCLSAMAERKTEERGKLVFLPNTLFWVGLLGNIFVIPSTLLLWREDMTHIWFLLLCLLGWSLELAHANCRVRFDERGFTHRSFFGRTHEFSYPDVTGIRRSDSGDVRLYCGKHMIFLDNMSVNMDRFMRLVDRKSKNLRVLPEHTGWDPFNHNVQYGKLLFFLFLGLTLFLTFLVPVCLYSVFGPPESEQTTERRELVFTEWKRTGKDDLYLTDAEGRAYGVEHWIRLPEEPETFCDGKTPCIVWGSGDKRFWIKQLQAGDRMLFTFEQAQEDYKSDQQLAPILILPFWSATVVFFAVMVWVGRHPERCSARTKHLIFGSTLKSAYPIVHPGKTRKKKP